MILLRSGGINWDHYSPYCWWHIFYNNAYYVIDGIHMVRHIKIIIISYQWLNVETKECLSSVKKCREQWRGTAAYWLLKYPGPERFTSFFQNRFHVLHIIFLNFKEEHMNIFFCFEQIQVLIELLVFNGTTFIFTVSRARPSWPEGRYSIGHVCSNGFLYS